MKLLIVLAVVLFILAVHQLLKVIELAREIRKTKEWEPTDSENDLMGTLMLLFGIIFLGMFFYQIIFRVRRFPFFGFSNFSC
jgi:hypothetical protein